VVGWSKLGVYRRRDRGEKGGGIRREKETSCCIEGEEKEGTEEGSGFLRKREGWHPSPTYHAQKGRISCYGDEAKVRKPTSKKRASWGRSSGRDRAGDNNRKQGGGGGDEEKKKEGEIGA